MIFGVLKAVMMIDCMHCIQATIMLYVRAASEDRLLMLPTVQECFRPPGN